MRLETLQSRGSELASAEAQLDMLGRVPLDGEHADALRRHGLFPLRSTGIRTLQLNVGRRCNLVCRHCHVDAGPDRPEVMSRAVMEHCLSYLEATDIPVVDITGGAPELVPDYRWLIERCRALGRQVMSRTNLTIVETPSHRDLPSFWAGHGVELLCSLPHYRPLNTDRMRGEGVFDKSINVLKRLNEVGYGDGRSGLRLVLVTNPVGAFLPGSQGSLEADFRSHLMREHGIRFDALYCITNMPIGRYLEWLDQTGNTAPYLQNLAAAFNPDAAACSMCRSTLSVSYDGRLHDCEFKQMLDVPVDPALPQHIADIDPRALDERTIDTLRCCFGCTAGEGSSCGGSTTG